MFKHEKNLLHPVRVDRPNRDCAAMMLEQLGGPNGELKAGLQYLSHAFRVRETIDCLLNREEAHNAMFREALNRVQGEGSNQDFGVTQDSRLYFDLSTPGRYFDAPQPTPPSFDDPRRGGQSIGQYEGERVPPAGTRGYNPPEAEARPHHYR